jgi:hypothetical protein
VVERLSAMGVHGGGGRRGEDVRRGPWIQWRGYGERAVKMLVRRNIKIFP